MAEEKPILFSGEMVRAILNGRKTQTRRVIPHAGRGYLGYIQERNTHWFGLDLRTVGNGPETSIEVSCPYGRPGDLLWVRETWKSEALYDHKKPSDIPHHANLLWVADEEIRINNIGSPFGKIRQSIFMPRWASRITLRVCDVRVERLQNMPPSDIMAEGVSVEGGTLAPIDHWEHAWRELWDSINAKRGYAWKDNPWVWVVEFERLN